MPSRAPRASRRAVLIGGGVSGAGVIVTTMAGCGTARTDADAGAGAGDPSGPAVDADSDLVEAVGAQLTDALSLALATGASLPRLKPLTRRLAALHRAHLDELNQPDEAQTGKVTGSLETAKARLLRSEEKLQGHLVQAALDAESGALAQVLAAMAAGVAQERAVVS